MVMMNIDRGQKLYFYQEMLKNGEIKLAEGTNKLMMDVQTPTKI